VEKIVAFGFLSLWVAGCSSTPSFDWPAENPFASQKESSLDDLKTEPRLELLFSANVLGETEPCGCASGPKGGLDRRLNFIKMTPSHGDRVVLDAGNALFATEAIDPAQKKAATERARLILQSVRTLGIRAMNIGYLDLSAGADFLQSEAKKLKLPLVSASFLPRQGESSWFKEYVDLQVASLNLRVTGLSAGRKGLTDLNHREPKEALSRIFAKTGEVDLYVVLSDLGRIQDEELLSSMPDVPVVIIGSRDLGSLDRPIVRSSKLLVQPAFRGQQWGSLRISWQRGAKGWFNLGHAPQYFELWDRMMKSRDHTLERASGSERKQELTGQIAAAQEILEQAPAKDGQKKHVFDYDLIDLGNKYLKTNELSQKMKEVNAL
jgi:2',3'-cyclic-nucleotide 2'-phosphodiesterase (5'-nucleotidase family)